MLVTRAALPAPARVGPFDRSARRGWDVVSEEELVQTPLTMELDDEVVAALDAPRERS